MPIQSESSFRSLRTLGCRALVAGLAAGLAAWLAGCATDRLAAAPSKAVDLSGEWQINLNLSDDPGKPPVNDSAPGPGPGQRHRGGGGRGGGMGGPGGLGSPGSPGGLGLPGGAGGPANSPPDGENFTGGGGGAAILGGASDEPARARPVLLEIGPQASGGGRGSRGADSGLLDSPERMTITQHGSNVTVQSTTARGDTVTTEYTVGQQSNVPFADGTAERTVGWRDSIFVVDTKVKSGPEKELDFALDDDGRLIVATLVTGRHVHKADLKFVYDRVKPAR